MANVLVRHVEIALVTPVLAPRISHNEALLEIIKAHSSHCMAATNLVTWLGHQHLSCLHHLLITKAGQDSETKHERVTIPDAMLHLIQILCNMGIALHFALLSQFVALLLRLCLEEGGTVIIFPHTLRAHTHLLHDFDSISQASSGIFTHAAFYIPLVVVDEQSAGREVFEVWMVLNRHLVKGEMEGCCQGICRTAAQMSLIEDGEAAILRSQVHNFLVSLTLLLHVAWSSNTLEVHVEITVIWEIRNPSKLLYSLGGHTLQASMSLRVHLDLILRSCLALAPTHDFLRRIAECKKGERIEPAAAKHDKVYAVLCNYHTGSGSSVVQQPWDTL